MPHPVDIHVGVRLRQARKLKGLTQNALGETVGLTFQQIQKYERGANRISASKLFRIGQVLGFAPDWFFEGLDKGVKPASPDTFHQPETLELVRAYYSISNPKTRAAVAKLIKDLAR